MELRRIPILPTLLVLIAAAVMVRLGFWQLGKLEQKEALLARDIAAQGISADVVWPRDAAALEQVLFRHTRIACRSPGPDRPIAGHNAAGQTGWAHVYACDIGHGRKVSVVLGWSKDPVEHVWSGGEVGGVIAPGGRLVADKPLAGLEVSAGPKPRDNRNTHLSYAVQWFAFALTALVIYALALRKRLRGM